LTSTAADSGMPSRAPARRKSSHNGHPAHDSSTRRGSRRATRAAAYNKPTRAWHGAAWSGTASWDGAADHLRRRVRTGDSHEQHWGPAWVPRAGQPGAALLMCHSVHEEAGNDRCSTRYPRSIRRRSSGVGELLEATSLRSPPAAPSSASPRHPSSSLRNQRPAQA
jgi:hypothetical protein